MTTRRQIIVFILVGGLNTIFGYSCYAFFIFFGLHYSLAALFSTCIGVFFNYKTTGKIVFNNSNNNSFVKFIIIYVLLYFFYITFIKLVHLLENNLYISGFIALVPYAAAAFILNKYIVFRKDYEIN